MWPKKTERERKVVTGKMEEADEEDVERKGRRVVTY